MASFTKFGNDLYTGERSLDIVGRRRIWFTIALVLTTLSILMPFVRGFEFGIEFTGGSEFTVSAVGESPDEAPAVDAVTSVAEITPRVSIVGGDSVRVQTTQLTQAESNEVRDALAEEYGVPVSEVATSFIGPSWGADITNQAIRALVVFLLLAGLGMALYFRTWKMAVAAMVALLHDLVVVVGIYALVGFEVTPAAVIGFLTILGYSLYDTIVVFDKVRENTNEDGEGSRRTYPETVNLAVNQTLVRSINTSIVAVLPVAAILFIGSALLGAGTLRDIALALFVGIIAGTYSTIFIAAPLYAKLREGEEINQRREEKASGARVTSGAVR